MNLNISEWKPFLIGRIFTVKYGINLELDSLNESSETDSVNFVSRCISNNGVSAKVEPISGLEPQAAGIISVAGGGSSVLSTYVQEEPFYSGRDLYLLIPKMELSKETKMFITTIIEKNKYRYSFGRQANKTLPFLEILLPIKYSGAYPAIDTNYEYSDEGYIPDWLFMEDYIKSLHYKPLTTENKNQNTPNLNTEGWKTFTFGKLINRIYKLHAYNKEEVTREELTSQSFSTNYVTRTAENNGCELSVNGKSLDHIEDGNAITIGDTTATCFYQKDRFVSGDHMIAIRANWLNKYTGLFIVTLLNFEKYRYSYGRAFLMDRVKETEIKLPILKDVVGNPIIDANYTYSHSGFIPDWEFMETYIKSLPYGDKI